MDGVCGGSIKESLSIEERQRQRKQSHLFFGRPSGRVESHLLPPRRRFSAVLDSINTGHRLLLARTPDLASDLLDLLDETPAMY